VRELRSAWLLVRKDVVSLRRAPLVVILLACYPLLIAGLIGLVAGYANARPRVAIVDRDHLPAKTRIAGHNYHIKHTIDEVAKNVRLSWMSKSEADQALRTGKVVGVITIPSGFLADLKSTVRSPTLEFESTQGGISSRVNQQMEALVYSLNRKLQDAYLEDAIHYISLIRRGGKTEFLGTNYDVLGIAKAKKLLRSQKQNSSTAELMRFLDTAEGALRESQVSAKAIAQPIKLDTVTSRGRSWLLSAQMQAYALALTISILALALGAAVTASERDENVAPLLGRGLVSMRAIVAAKTVLATLVSLLVAIVILVAFGMIVDIAGIAGGQPWQRIPLVLAGVVLFGAGLGAIGTLIGALAREGRSATLGALLVALPIVLLGLIPKEIVPPAGIVSDAFPFSHGEYFFSSALYDAHPWATLGPEALWLAGLLVVWAAIARLALPRLTEG
jgi:ABC-type transport system involved in multi-copper enzyme maturation permease subunit